MEPLRDPKWSRRETSHAGGTAPAFNAPAYAPAYVSSTKRMALRFA